MGRRYRRRNSSSSIISDTVYVSSKLPWWGALIFGTLTFTVFYFIIPAWFSSRAAVPTEGTLFTPDILEAIIAPRIHWFERIGIACGLVGLFFCVRNYLLLSHAGYRERGVVGILARLFGRELN